jgi:hypothetical protein
MEGARASIGESKNGCSVRSNHAEASPVAGSGTGGKTFGRTSVRGLRFLRLTHREGELLCRETP